MNHPIRLAFMFSCLFIAALACGPFGSNEDQQATIEALGQSVVQTSTAVVVVGSPTVVDTEATVAAIKAEATEQVIEVEATKDSRATEIAFQATATENALTPIRNELPSYGVDSFEGDIGWIHEPLTLQSEGYLQHAYGGDFLSTVVDDFVLAADITWNTRFGSTACGFVIRTDGNEEAFNQYLVLATRGATGHVGFVIMQDGEVLDREITDIFARGIDPEFKWRNDTTNRMVIVGRGNTFTIYTNGTKIGEVSPSVEYPRGFAAFVALNESGDTTCHFNNAWLWLLN